MDDCKHCDDYIDDPAQPECLRKFLDKATGQSVVQSDNGGGA